MISVRSNYLRNALIYKSRKKLIDQTVKAIRELRRKKKKIDCLVFTGVSGMLIGVSVADTLKLPFLIVRKHKGKNKENSHFDGELEGTIDTSKYYLMIDDFIGTGATFRRVAKALKKESLMLIGILCYNYMDNKNQFFDPKKMEKYE